MSTGELGLGWLYLLTEFPSNLSVKGQKSSKVLSGWITVITFGRNKMDWSGNVRRRLRHTERPRLRQGQGQTDDETRWEKSKKWNRGQKRIQSCSTRLQIAVVETRFIIIFSDIKIFPGLYSSRWVAAKAAGPPPWQQHARLKTEKIAHN